MKPTSGRLSSIGSSQVVMIDGHTTRTLEFRKIVSLIRGKCLTVYGGAEVDGIGPLDNKAEIEQSLAEISEMKDIVNFGTPFPLCRIENDGRDLLSKAQVEGNFLDPQEMLLILELVEISSGLNGYDEDGRDKYPLIDDYLCRLRAFPELAADIKRTVDEDGNVRDKASPALRKVRADLWEGRRKIVGRLEGILSARVKQTGWQDDVITQRNDRYVIPIPSSRYRGDMGILHDRSQSGATLFIEPKETVELNNRINLLLQEEKAEVRRILLALTAEIARRSESLLENTRLIGTLDRLHAAALFSNQIKGNRPMIVAESSVDLVDARHPLLIVQLGSVSEVVPISIGLDQLRQVVLVTGPNTGGKTICLKTVGLSVLMALSGLHIAADEKSQVGLFRDVFADIGDEQSIELSLSTFSSHIRNIIRGLVKASARTLLLFDEIGAGTDPKEGSALAEAIIVHAIERKARLIATTHYSQLKMLAMEHTEVENASLEFNRETLGPTYRLRMGLPGSSYAVEIAGRLGMPDSICRNAARLRGSDEKSLDNLVASIESELARIKIDRKELSERLARAREHEEEYRRLADRLKAEVDAEKQKALDETERFLAETRREVESLVAKIRKSQASQKAVHDFHENLRKREKGAVRRAEELRQQPPGSIAFQPGDSVRIISLGKDGEITVLVGKERARVSVGNIVTTVELRNLALAESAHPPEALRRAAGYSIEETVRPEIHLRGMTGDEAIEQLDRYLDRAVMAGLHQVYVIHGKGTGTLQRLLTNYLKGHPEVASLRMGDWNEGGAGVTIVKLKE